MPPADEPRRRYTRPIELGVLEVAKRKAASQLSVFLAGPYIDTGWTAEQVAAAPAGARLRASLKGSIEALEHQLVLGEHRGVAEVTGDHIPTAANIALSELQLVEDADAVIIVPDSPGSFCELGSWVMREDFCAKTLVLGNGLYENIFGYVSHGVFLMAEHLNARVEWIDYENLQGAHDLVAEFLSSIQDRLISRRLRRGQ